LELDDYYPPDVDVSKVAQQDHTLSDLNLVDVRKETLHLREKALEERGKLVRVSVVDGLRIRPKDFKKEGGKKKKKR
jgi:hypothetical protein